MTRVPVLVYADDPVNRSGVEAQLRGRAGVELRDVDDWDPTEEPRPDEPPTVAVLVVDEVDDAATRSIRALARRNHTRVLVVAGRLDDAGVLAVTEAGAAGLLRRADAVPERLVPAVTSVANGEGTVPPDLLGRLLEQVGQLQRQVLSPRGLTFSGLAQREVQVLRLVADGADTAEIARTLAYSERTVKNIIHDVTSRLQLRNRSHAVAWAVRQGLI
ncbi:MAG TPA: response regulator transcription factor [Acidimicrobiales bacterium]